MQRKVGGVACLFWLDMHAKALVWHLMAENIIYRTLNIDSSQKHIAFSKQCTSLWQQQFKYRWSVSFGDKNLLYFCPTDKRFPITWPVFSSINYGILQILLSWFCTHLRKQTCSLPDQTNCNKKRHSFIKMAYSCKKKFLILREYTPPVNKNTQVIPSLVDQTIKETLLYLSLISLKKSIIKKEQNVTWIV